MLQRNQLHQFYYGPAQSVANLVYIRSLLELVVSQRQEDSEAILNLQIVRKVRVTSVISCSYPLNSRKERCSGDQSAGEGLHSNFLGESQRQPARSNVAPPELQVSTLRRRRETCLFIWSLSRVVMRRD